MANAELRKQEVLEYIRERLYKGETSPTVREICKELGFKSTSTVHLYLKQLEAAGLISMNAGQNRSIRLHGESIVQVPLLGTIQAGQPILAAQDVQEYVPFRETRGMGRELFALKVRGESMVDAGILEGDVIIAQRISVAENGQIVAALIGEEATVKRFFREPDGQIRLQPENAAMEPIFVAEEDCRVLGRVVSIMRYYE